MQLLQLSAAYGPAECCLAVVKALARLQYEAKQKQVEVQVLEQEPAKHGLHSVLVSLEGTQASALADMWQGTIQWVCTSPYRPQHKRKNWFIGASCFNPVVQQYSDEIVFETMRSSGAGGQHVNKTESAVRATHTASGISVKVQSERSQHANKKLAVLLLQHKLLQQEQRLQASNKAAHHKHHHQIARGNPVRIFTGMDFKAL
ncbi:MULTISPECIES: peptide chain release factor H [unclassified Snodgrassella]|uniref:peptide chain release factor H n=1 Tax=unclassified Snodgrassella TaxID=2625236 RepID=UPI0004D4FB91|nr:MULTISPECIES: peptide chain release factor H [unclassified Snodgrassella]KES13562.1 Protein chain release factor B [Snodgrassella alvi SCGC AB-598-P14]MBI0130271.1 peptide chain release factor H [Snodgrassella sp. W8124]NUE81642.1 peptide chain release factor H [Snodgrassella sp. ESL0304]